MMAGEADRPAAGEASARHMLELITGAWKTQAVHAFAALAIADELAGGPASVDALAARLAVDRAALGRLLRAGAALGLVAPAGRGSYAGTPLLATLRRDAHGSLRGLAMAVAMPGHWQPWGALGEAVRLGQRQTVATLGGELWDYYQRTPREAHAFSDGMTALTQRIAAEAAAVLETRGGRVAVDVGGASGALVLAMMEHDPALRGVVLDLAHVVPDAIAAAAARGLAARFSAVAGSFFDPLPRADLYLLKHVLHDWDDAACTAILANCRHGLEPGGRVAILELAVSDDAPAFAALMDLTMLVLTPGRERSIEEYEALLAHAGLRLRTAAPLASLPAMVVMEAVVP